MQQPIFDALRRGAHQEALALAGAAVADAPGDAQAHRALALAERASGHGDGGRGSIERALMLAPDDADLHLQHAGFLLDAAELGSADRALERAVQLDPNQLAGYVMQSQLALARNDAVEAERVVRLASRVAPGHPWVRMVEGTLALRRGDKAAALALLSDASLQSPDDVRLLYVLGFAYAANGHLAFAEQALRGVLSRSAGFTAVRAQIAALLRMQGRPEDAFEMLEPLLETAATPPMRRFAAELLLESGRLRESADQLDAALAEMPADPRALDTLMAVARAGGDAAALASTVDSALARTTRIPALWHARIGLAATADESTAQVARWRIAEPESTAALEADLALRKWQGHHDEAESVARAIVARVPGHGQAEMYLIDRLTVRDPDAAVAHVEGLLVRAEDTARRSLLLAWLALASDRAGDHARAAAIWIDQNAADASLRLPLPPLTTPAAAWPARPAAPPDAAPVAFLIGPPGSLVERVGVVLGSVETFRADRFGASPPMDLLQHVDAPARLASGALAAATVFESWRAALPSRGLDRQAVDWLIWWDDALVAVLRKHMPGATLVIAVRDPRDMLLDWLAFGGPAPLRFESPTRAATWLALQLEHLAAVTSDDRVMHALVRMDVVGDDPERLAGAVSTALETPIPPPVDALGPARFPPGHWRRYAGPLGDAFDILGPVASRLGYPAD